MNYEKFGSSAAVEEEPSVDREKLKSLILRLLPTERGELIRRLSLGLKEEENSSHYAERKKQAEEILSIMEKKDAGLQILRDEIFAVASGLKKEKN